MTSPKLRSMRDAIARYVPDGASLCMGVALEAAIPCGPVALIAAAPTAAELAIVRECDAEGFWTR